MYALILLFLMALLVYRHSSISQDQTTIIPRGISQRLTGLWAIAYHGMRENRMLRAEKALLTILKIDEKNANAYNRLGILYAKQREYKDAIDCFKIASSLEYSASSLHNLGLIYYETENYDKAAVAFEEAIKLEDSLATRHIAYAKVQEKLGNKAIVLEALQKAVKLEPTKETFAMLVKAYEDQGMIEAASNIKRRLGRLAGSTKPVRRLLRPRRVII